MLKFVAFLGKAWAFIKKVFSAILKFIKEKVVPFVKKYWKQLLIALSVLIAFLLGVKVNSVIKEKKAKKAVTNADLQSNELKKKQDELLKKADDATNSAMNTVEKAEETKKESEDARKTVAEAIAKRKKKAAELKDKVLPIIFIVLLLIGVGGFNVGAEPTTLSPSYEKLMQSYLEAVDIADQYKQLYEEAETDNETLLLQLEKNEKTITDLQLEVINLTTIVDELKALIVEKDKQIADTNNVIIQMQGSVKSLENATAQLLDKVNSLLKKDKFSIAVGVEGAALFNFSTASTSALTVSLQPQASLYARFEYRF